MRKSLLALLAASILSLGHGPSLAGELELSSPAFVPDREFPRLIRYVQDGWDLKRGMGEERPYSELVPPGVTLHVIVQNPSKVSVEIDKVLLNGVDLSRHLVPGHREHRGIRAASYLLNDATTTDAKTREHLDRLGAPIWYQVHPNPIPAGGFAELVVRLRRLPDEERLKLGVMGTEGQRAEVHLSRDCPAELSIASVCFSQQIDRVFLFLRRDEEKEFKVRSVTVDGADVKRAPGQCWESCGGFLPLELPLGRAWEHGSFHHLGVRTEEGLEVGTVVRARDAFFALGMWGYRNYGNTDEERARDTCTALRDHLFNTHMGMGHGGTLSKTRGLEMLEQLGLRLMARDPTKETSRSPQLYARFLLDEPDAHEHAIGDLPGHLRVGSYAQGLVGRQRHWTEVDSRTLTLLNVDLTFKPENWLIYGQLPDIFALDPYYQMRLLDVYSRHPGWLAQYCHPYYVYALSEIARFASEPRPLHVILNAVSYQKEGITFRYGTPEEKRIEFYYALAAGAKGISYWWFTPYGTYRGCGADDDGARAMMQEMRRLNAEARAMEPLLATSCPAAAAGSRGDPFLSARPPWLMSRTLFAGPSTAVVVLVNRDHASDRLGTLYEPIPKAPLTFRVPPWLEPAAAFRLAKGQAEKMPWTREGELLQMTLNDIALTELLVITEDPTLEEEVRQRMKLPGDSR